MKRGVCLFEEGLTDLLIHVDVLSMHGACTCIGVAHPPTCFLNFRSVSTLPSRKSDTLWFKQTDGLSAEMVQLLGGEVLQNQMPPQHTRGECNFLLSLRKTKTHPAPIHCPPSLLISTATWILLSSGDSQPRAFHIFWAHAFKYVACWLKTNWDKIWNEDSRDKACVEHYKCSVCRFHTGLLSLT